MILDIRSYRPDAVNIVAKAHDYYADRMSRTVLADLLEDARALAENAGNSVPDRGLYPMLMLNATHALAEQNVTLLMGALAQAEQALASYPADVVEYAEQRFDF